MRSPQCHQVKDRGRVEELKKRKRGTRGTREAEQGHMRETTGGQKMYSRGTLGEQQRYNRGTTPNCEYIIQKNKFSVRKNRLHQRVLPAGDHILAYIVLIGH